MISRPAPGLLVLVLIGTFLLQAPRQAPAAAAASFRPALVGNGPKSLVNLIDTQKLLAKGQGDGVVMFDVSIEDDPAGSVRWIWCHAAPGSRFSKRRSRKAAPVRFFPGPGRWQTGRGRLSRHRRFLQFAGAPLSARLRQSISERARAEKRSDSNRKCDLVPSDWEKSTSPSSKWFGSTPGSATPPSRSRSILPGRCAICVWCGRSPPQTEHRRRRPHLLCARQIHSRFS